ncbi:MAG: thioredoxin [Bacilli bacterium]|nr:thioredoxin [Bacilli bacterium]
MKYIEKENEFEEIIKNEKVLVDFYATWCGPCQLLSPILEELEKENKELTIVKIDVDKNENLARKHGVMSIPTIEIYNKGNLVNKQVGLLSKEELEDLLK